MNNAQLQAIYSDRVAESNPEQCEPGTRQRKVLKHFRSASNRLTILDVGCADGQFLAPLAEEHCLYGIDVSESMLRLASKAGYQVVRKAEDDGTISFSNFDAVFCGECIEHIVDTDMALSEMNRVLKPGGMLVLTFPNVRTPISLLAMLCNRAPMFAARYGSGHVRDFTTRSMRQALEANGFRVDGMEGVDFCVSSRPVGVLPWLASWLPSWASTVVVKATKAAEAKYEVRSHL